MLLRRAPPPRRNGRRRGQRVVSAVASFLSLGIEKIGGEDEMVRVRVKL
jgi:hypothetical protein